MELNFTSKKEIMDGRAYYRKRNRDAKQRGIPVHQLDIYEAIEKSCAEDPSAKRFQEWLDNPDPAEREMHKLLEHLDIPF